MFFILPMKINGRLDYAGFFCRLRDANNFLRSRHAR